MENRVKCHNPQNISGDSQQNSDAAFSLTTEGDVKEKNKHRMAPYSSSGVIQVSKLIWNAAAKLQVLAHTLSEVCARAWPHGEGVDHIF